MKWPILHIHFKSVDNVSFAGVVFYEPNYWTNKDFDLMMALDDNSGDKWWSQISVHKSRRWKFQRLRPLHLSLFFFVALFLSFCCRATFEPAGVIIKLWHSFVRLRLLFSCTLHLVISQHLLSFNPPPLMQFSFLSQPIHAFTLPPPPSSAFPVVILLYDHRLCIKPPQH